MTDVTVALPPMALWLGLVLGVRHAADPDHVVAIGTIAAHTRRVWPAARLGVLWGLGHTLTLSTVAAGIVLFEWAVPARLGLGMEFCVAMALVGLGVANLSGHGRDRHRTLVRGPMGAFLIGLVHGLAGSAAVALLVVATVGEPQWAMAYLLTFGAGTLLGMTGITTGLALSIGAAAHRWRPGPSLLRAGSGALSVALGVWIAYDIGWNGGLFAATPSWTPH
jgi:hypothetical protein